MGHNLGINHDFVDVRPTYSQCRKHSDGSTLSCWRCANHQSGNTLQAIGQLTGRQNDCCNGFMGYYDHPHYWSDCSNRDFEQHYVSRNWAQCMDSTTGKLSCNALNIDK